MLGEIKTTAPLSSIEKEQEWRIAEISSNKITQSLKKISGISGHEIVSEEVNSISTADTITDDKVKKLEDE